jgi:L-lactate dehydrogenase complex protein LldE
MQVKLMLTCLCDAFYGEVGIATVRVLEHAGCQVEFDERQTCCGQPPFNAGDWTSARAIALRNLEIIEPAPSKPQYLVTPSSSCAAMIREGYHMLFPEKSIPHCYELSEFMLSVVGVDRWPLQGNRISRRRKVAFHRACHSRALGNGDSQERLLSMVPGLDLALFEQQEQCCGFGGAFSATHGCTSAGIGIEKLRNIADSGVGDLVSGDMGCLMHLNGLIQRHRLDLRTRHYVELLAEAI